VSNIIFFIFFNWGKTIGGRQKPADCLLPRGLRLMLLPTNGGSVSGRGSTTKPLDWEGGNSTLELSLHPLNFNTFTFELRPICTSLINRQQWRKNVNHRGLTSSLIDIEKICANQMNILQETWLAKQSPDHFSCGTAEVNYEHAIIDDRLYGRSTILWSKKLKPKHVRIKTILPDPNGSMFELLNQPHYQKYVWISLIKFYKFVHVSLLRN